MSKRTPPATHRTYQPLKPCNFVTFVDGELVSDISPDNITIAKVGLKAFGLVSIPQVWIKPFFVVSGNATPTHESLSKALQSIGICLSDRVIVRSSGVEESIDQRGALESAECEPKDIGEKIIQLRDSILKKKGPNVGLVHWIVQVFVDPSAKGHLANERRLCKVTRDWVAEVEPSLGYVPERHNIAIREWRDARQIVPQSLDCIYRSNYIKILENVARWALDRQLRIHFEWVWDGKTVYIVQADECSRSSKGVFPKDLVKTPDCFAKTIKTELFRIAEPDDFSTYRKLSNVSWYQKLGYQMVDFFVLDDANEISKLLEGKCSKKLLAELNLLTKSPLVIRTDGADIPSNQRQMLPRSDELRSLEAAEQWLLNYFRPKIIELKLDECRLCLIAHHFLPATTSAWCQAYPDRRRVRIESLWGIPEGLYWHAHDVFDVDTLVNNVTLDEPPPKNFTIKERLRCKGQFIAPNNSGEWVLHQTADGPDWQRSIHRKQWISEIAWTSRRIAVAENKPVVVMWLIDIPKALSPHSIMPWYHEEWKNTGCSPKAAPRKKLSSSAEFIIHTIDDWELLKEQCQSGAPFVRIIVDPTESELIRDQQFAYDLAALAKEKNFVVELSGGILSHAYYLLSSSGCKVECTDLYATEDEELEFNKLVRDYIPDGIAARGENVELLKLEGEALITALKRKVIEEAFEVADSKTSQQLIEEFADLYEVIDALAAKLGIEKKTIIQTQKEKAKKRGRFEKGLMLTRTSLASTLGENESRNDDPLFSSIPPHERTISGVNQIPSQAGDIHIDKRHDFKGTLERQLTISLPVHTLEVKSQMAHFSLETQEGYPHELMLEVLLERTNATLRCKFRLINAQVQLDLPE